MNPNIQRQKIRITGVVQGVGFRPFIWRLAQQMGLSGWIINDSEGVLIEIQGEFSVLEKFKAQVFQQLPPLGKIDQYIAVDCSTVLDELTFEIRNSRFNRATAAWVSPDIATCDQCLQECDDNNDPRYRYPFINCTNCGPRFTIIRQLPYDRSRTTMDPFELCNLCRQEYNSPQSRRFHAEPIACPQCGPSVWLIPTQNQSSGREHLKSEQHPNALSVDVPNHLLEEYSAGDGISDQQAAIDETRRRIAAGQIVAIKGIGGFHLACDAFQESAVQRLRKLKHRPAKPLAVMVADLNTAKQMAKISDAEAELLFSPARPIVLLHKSPHNLLAAAVAPSNPQIGIMLTYSALHRLLIRPGECWVMTSGNLTDEPICYQNTEGWKRLSPICDAILFHNRPIYTVCDDSVIRCVGGAVLPIRRSRGYAPLPIRLPENLVSPNNTLIINPAVSPIHSPNLPIETGASPVNKVEWSPMQHQPSPGCLLAVGGELKTTVCLAIGRQAIVSQHIGDMGNYETLLGLDKTVQHLLDLYQTQPTAVIVDRHPAYHSSAWGQQFADRIGVPIVKVQHHHAHLAALMVEHQIPVGESIIGCVFDGTGYGDDEAIWGGEWLVGSYSDYRRWAQLNYTPLPGGDAAIRQPARTALAQLHHYNIEWAQDLPPVQFFDAKELKLLRHQLDRNLASIPTSSMGRFFDGVAAVLGIRQQIDFEGQAAIELEILAQGVFEEPEFADQVQTIQPYPFSLIAAESSLSATRLYCEPIWRSILSDLARHVPTAIIAARFHQTIVQASVEICQRASRETGIKKVGLTGGVFQNGLLTTLLRTALQRLDFEVLTHLQVPPNDGGLALGQVAIACSAS